MYDYLPQLEAVIRALKFHSSTSYSWFGKLSPPFDTRTREKLTPQVERSYLLYSLQQQLYNDFYCQGWATPAELEPFYPAQMFGLTPFVEALSAANCGEGCYEDGWRVCTVEENFVVVRKDTLQIWAQAQDCRIAEGSAFAPGAALNLRFPKELLNISPGYYMVLGNMPLPGDEEQTVIRFYWNLSAEGAASFVKHTTAMLNEAPLPFRLKVLRDPAMYRRCDAGVVYTSKRNYDEVAALLASVYREIAPMLKHAVPAFTKLLAPGLGLAEDTGYSESFGEHRCRLFAQALIQAHELGQTSLHHRLETVIQFFAQAQVRLDAPYLSHGSSDEYHFSF